MKEIIKKRNILQEKLFPKNNGDEFNYVDNPVDVLLSIYKCFVDKGFGQVLNMKDIRNLSPTKMYKISEREMDIYLEKLFEIGCISVHSEAKNTWDVSCVVGYSLQKM